MENLSILQIKKMINHASYVWEENHGIMIKFLPTGQLMIYGKDPKQPYRYNYTIYNKVGKTSAENKVIMNTSPHIMNTPGDMELLVMKNHITLTSIANPSEICHFSRLNLKSY